MATYELNDFIFTAGDLQRWQGYDAGLDDGWVDTEEIVEFGLVGLRSL